MLFPSPTHHLTPSLITQAPPNVGGFAKYKRSTYFPDSKSPSDDQIRGPLSSERGKVLSLGRREDVDWWTPLFNKND